MSLRKAKVLIKAIESNTDVFGLYGQVNKRIRWMPRQ